MEKNFENSLLELEKVIRQLESNEVTLEESISLFEKGVKLSNDCRKILETAEKKIITLTDAEREEADD